MDFDLSDEQKQLRSEVRRFAENEVEPVAMEYDVEEAYPWDVIEEAAEMGLLGAQIPVEYGGGGYDTLDFCLVIEELFAADPGIGLCLTSTAFGSEAIMEFGTEEQKEEYLPPIAEGEAIMGAAISEPDTGSDVSSVSTRAEKEGDEWVIDGNKMWITNGSVGDFFVVLCKTDPDAEGRYNGFSQIVVEADRDGFDREKITGKLGIRASDTAELLFDGVRVPEENLVGTRGMGFLQQMQFFDETRTGVAAQAVGIARGAAERALDYAGEREQFGKPISKFDAVRDMIVGMDRKIERSRLLTHKAATQYDTGGEVTKSSSLAKLDASETAREVAEDAVQVLGGYGYTTDFAPQRFYRDAKLMEIGEGTSEIQRKVIGRELGL